MSARRSAGSGGRRSLDTLARSIPRCAACPELRAYCAEVAREKRRAFRADTYWGRPVPGFGDPGARIWILGLAPAAHGANRTGRMFTGDRSGDFLYAGLHRAGLASQPTSVARDDGLRLRDVWISASLRCAPPGNRPTPGELANCERWLDAERGALSRVRVLFCLGAIAWEAGLALEARHGETISRPRPRFAHGIEVRLRDRWMVGCYHVSQQNTFTGKLTPGMLDGALRTAIRLANVRVPTSPGGPASS